MWELFFRTPAAPSHDPVMQQETANNTPILLKIFDFISTVTPSLDLFVGVNFFDSILAYAFGDVILAIIIWALYFKLIFVFFKAVYNTYIFPWVITQKTGSFKFYFIKFWSLLWLYTSKVLRWLFKKSKLEDLLSIMKTFYNKSLWTKLLVILPSLAILVLIRLNYLYFTSLKWTTELLILNGLASFFKNYVLIIGLSLIVMVIFCSLADKPVDSTPLVNPLKNLFTLEIFNRYMHIWYIFSFASALIYNIAFYWIHQHSNLLITLADSTQTNYRILLNNLEVINAINFTPIGAALLLLAFLVIHGCKQYLAEHELLQNKWAPVVFLLFILNTILLITTTNFFVLLISFEMLFMPSIYFAFKNSYSYKADKSTTYLLVWTYFGSFASLCLGLYLFITMESLSYYTLTNRVWSISELQVIYLILFLSFGVKIPVFPFHYWLTKIHVEATAGFSMFLSGFLVKTALFCIYIQYKLFFSPELTRIFVIFLIVSALDASIKMLVQVDIKKLIAYATIQEMNLLLLLVLVGSFANMILIYLFILMHGLISVLLFCVVDIINKRFGSRNIFWVGSVAHLFPKLAIVIWFIFFNFVGFPLTVKLIIEWALVIHVHAVSGWLGTWLFSLVILLGNVGFARVVQKICFGTPLKSVTLVRETSDLTKAEKLTLNFWLVCLVILWSLLFIL